LEETPRLLLVVGLGNPGPEYRLTRHNAGFLVVERLSARLGGRWRRGLFANAEVARVVLGGRAVALCKPLTYMNLTGRAVGPLMRREGLEPADLLLVYDDMDLPLGRLRIRPGGGPGGHRGVASVLQAVGSEEVARVRVGIGRPPDGVDAAQYVLAPVPPAERALWSEAVERGADAVESVILDGLAVAMDRWNGRNSG
jgi:PTH1 family peptidyl-tRNA hydrolase